MEKYFLGANSGSGFISLYDDFCAAEGDTLHLIKGGAGCGKSSFMRRIARAAEDRGFDVEYVLCSGDPDSLDGIYIPALKLGYADATAPHVIEPRLFGVDSDYVNLGQFCATPPREDIRLYTAKYKACYARAYSLLAASSEIKNAPFPGLIDGDTLEKVRNRARSTAKRVLGKADSGSVKKCFTHAISCKGDIVLNESVHKLCKLNIMLDDRYGLAKHFLRELTDAAQQRGDGIIICLSPLMPEQPEAVIFPQHGVGFFSAAVYESCESCRHVRLDALIPRERLMAYRGEIKKSEKFFSDIMGSVYCSLAEAKRWHDELEKAYRPYIDFAALNEFAEAEIKSVLES